MPNTLTTQSPGQPPQTRPIPPSWAEVAPLLARWQMALIPYADRSWDVLAGYPRGWTGPMPSIYGVPFAGLPQAILEVSQRCEAAAAGAGEGEA
ncbi:MAG TPA: hypothetical protein VLK82_15675 [Candidatus Tectomicrobia bacterium]|nr:hypothetical protein [Candidatus Tectomicrobia bacterium]